jgi:hypothetical protein
MEVDEVTHQHQVPDIQVLIPEVREIERRRRTRLATRSFLVVVVVLAILISIATIAARQSSHRTGTTSPPTTIAQPVGPGTLRVPGMLQGVSCPSPAECWAVGWRVMPGYVNGASPTRSLIERWSGGRWRVVASPKTSSPDNSLAGVDCPTPSWCLAIDNAGSGEFNGGVAAQWSGHAWAISSGTGNAISSAGLSCPRIDLCFTVGTNSGGPYAEAALWNGSTSHLLNVPDAGAAILLGADCVGARSCWFVGEVLDSVGSQGNGGVVEHWIDGRWTVRHVGPVPRSNYMALDAVKCIGPSFCMAIGTDETGPLSAMWNGVVWRILPMPRAADAGQQPVIACSSTSNCLAVDGTVVDRFNGRSWSSVPVRTPRGLAGINLFGVAVERGSDYLVVGSEAYGTNALVVIERYNGRSLTLLQG